MNYSGTSSSRLAKNDCSDQRPQYYPAIIFWVLKGPGSCLQCVCVCVLCAQSLSCVRLCDPVGCIARQTPLSTEFFRHDTGVGCHFLLQGTFLTQGSKLRLMHLLLTTTPPGNAQLPPVLSPKAQSYLLVQESASLPSGALALSHQMVTGRRSHRSHLPTLRLNALTPPRGLGSSWSAFPGENALRKRAQASRHTKA